MTQEEKAKAYDEVLERAQKATRAGSDVAMDIIQYIFPNINDSEDERIRKELIEFIQWSEDRGMTRHDFHQAKRPSEWIAYLEKQKAQDKCPEFCNGHCVGCEKQKEQKPNFDTRWENGSMVCEMKHYWKPTETDVALFNKAVTTNKALTPSERAQLDIIRSKFGCCRAINCNGIVQEEQKSVDVIKGVNGVPCHSGNQIVDVSSAECSEEDEDIKELVISDLCTLKDWIIKYDTNWLVNPVLKNIDKRISWLKSLPLRKKEDLPKWKKCKESHKDVPVDYFLNGHNQLVNTHTDKCLSLDDLEKLPTEE